MSSIPLISHHLFMAAVAEQSGVSRAARRAARSLPARDVRVKEISVELIELVRPLPQTGSAFAALPWIGST
jgi:hypothetical protein